MRQIWKRKDGKIKRLRLDRGLMYVTDMIRGQISPRANRMRAISAAESVVLLVALMLGSLRPRNMRLDM